MDSPITIKNKTLGELISAGVIPLRGQIVGSVYITGKGKDLDILVLVGDLGKVVARAQKAGFVPDVSCVYDDAYFVSMRKGPVNVILTDDSVYYEDFVTAAQVCRLLNVRDKNLRVVVHNLVRDRIAPIDLEFDLSQPLELTE